MNRALQRSTVFDKSTASASASSSGATNPAPNRNHLYAHPTLSLSLLPLLAFLTPLPFADVIKNTTTHQQQLEVSAVF
jgi:hypothetical protein